MRMRYTILYVYDLWDGKYTQPLYIIAPLLFFLIIFSNSLFQFFFCIFLILIYVIFKFACASECMCIRWLLYLYIVCVCISFFIIFHFVCVFFCILRALISLYACIVFPFVWKHTNQLQRCAHSIKTLASYSL